MKTASLLSMAVVACTALTASAQTPTVINGHKVLVDKQGHVVRQPAHVAQPAPAPLVGGADSCVTPDVITGTGQFAFDNTVATTGAEGQTESACLAYGLTDIDNDVWFRWTATFTGYARVEECNGAGTDSKMAAYSGTTCPVPGSAIACNDDTCVLESTITFPVTSGNSYVIQIGNFSGATGSAGTFRLNPFTPVPTDDCQLPTVLAGPGTYAFDSSIATTSGEQLSVCALVEKDDWYSYMATQNGSATITTCGLITSVDDDTVIEIYDGSGCPTAASIACNDDACGLSSMVTWPTVCGQAYTIEVGAWDVSYNITGSFNITETGTPCAAAGVPYCFGDGTGTACPCGNNGATGNGCANSVVAGGGNLATTGTSSLANDTLVLNGTGMPNAACLYFQGTSQISVAFGDGLRCAGGTVVRLGTKTNSGGASHFPAAGDAAVHVKGAVTLPGTRSYQTWYRNAAVFCTPSTFNLTNGVLVTWQ